MRQRQDYAATGYGWNTNGNGRNFGRNINQRKGDEVKLTPQQIHDAKGFAKYFDGIPEDKWCEGGFTKGERHCALGHLGVQAWSHTLEGRAVILGELFRAIDTAPTIVNDNMSGRFQQPTGSVSF